MQTSTLILAVLVLVAIYLAYFFFSAYSTVVASSYQDLSATTVSTNLDTAVNSPDSTVYSVSMLMYAYKSPSSNVYIVFKNNTNPCFGLYINANSTNLCLDYYDNTSPAALKTIVISDNFPLQTWVHVVISVQTNYIDVYVQGKLAKSVKGALQAPATDTKLQFGGLKSDLTKKQTLPITLASVKYDTNATSPEEAWKAYSKSSTGTFGSFGQNAAGDKYGLQLGITKNSSVTGTPMQLI